MDWLNTRFAASCSLRPTAVEISATVPTPSTCESASTRKLRFPAEPTPAIAASPRRPTKYRSTRKYSVWNSMPAAIGTAIAMRCRCGGPRFRSFMRLCYPRTKAIVRRHPSPSGPATQTRAANPPPRRAARHTHPFQVLAADPGRPGAMSPGETRSPLRLAARMRPTSSADTLTGCTQSIFLSAGVWRGRGKLHELGPFGDLFADRDIEGLADSVRWCAERVLHLHGLEDQQGLAPCDARAGLDQQRHDPAGHDRADVALGHGLFSDVRERVDILEAMVRATKEDIAVPVAHQAGGIKGAPVERQARIGRGELQALQLEGTRNELQLVAAGNRPDHEVALGTLRAEMKGPGGRGVEPPAVGAAPDLGAGTLMSPLALELDDPQGGGDERLD